MGTEWRMRKPEIYIVKYTSLMILELILLQIDRGKRIIVCGTLYKIFNFISLRIWISDEELDIFDH